MNIKKFLGGTIAVFAFVFLYEWLVHGVFFRGYYAETPQIWREMNEMRSLIPLHAGFQLAFAAWVTFIFSRFYPEGGIRNGLFYGLYIGVLLGIIAASWYLFIPISKELATNWFVANVVEGLGLGLILGLIYCNCNCNKK